MKTRAPEPTIAGSEAKPAPTGRITVPAADGFKGFAMFGIICYHCLYATGRPPVGSDTLRNILLGTYMDVDFFFILSGFLLFLPVVQARGAFGDVKAYALRRAARILPVYYLALLVTQTFVVALTASPQDYPIYSPRGAGSMLLHMTFLQHTVGLAVGWFEGFNINGAVWTLTIDAAFYVVLPLVAAWYFRRPFVGLLIAVVVATVWKTGVGHGWIPLPGLPGLKRPAVASNFLVTQFPTYAAHFAAGMTAAWLFVKVRTERLRVRSAPVVVVQIAAAAVILYGMATGGGHDLNGTARPLDHWVATTPVALAFTVLLLATALAPRWAQWPFANPLARRLGDVSYGAYLFHLLLVGFALKTLHWTSGFGTTPDLVRMAVFVIPGALVLGALSFRYVEKPAMRWARERTRARAARAARPEAIQAPITTMVSSVVASPSVSQEG